MRCIKQLQTVRSPITFFCVVCAISGSYLFRFFSYCFETRHYCFYTYKECLSRFRRVKIACSYYACLRSQNVSSLYNFYSRLMMLVGCISLSSTYVFTNVPHEVSQLRETYATVRSKRYEPSWPQHLACYVRAVDPAVPDWDLAPVTTPTPTPSCQFLFPTFDPLLMLYSCRAERKGNKGQRC